MLARLEKQIAKEKRDVEVLVTVLRHEPIGIARIAEVSDIPEHKVRYSLRMLENDGFVEPTPEGATTPDDIDGRVERVNEGIDALEGRLRDLTGAGGTPG